MTQTQFTNIIDGTINDFTTGTIDSTEFKKQVLDVLLYSAIRKDSPVRVIDREYNILTKWFIPGEKGDLKADFFTHNMIAGFLQIYGKIDSNRIYRKAVSNTFSKMGIELATYQRPYEKLASYGYWLQPTNELLNLIE